MLSEFQSTGIVNKSSGVNWNAFGKYALAGGATVVAGYVVYLSPLKVLEKVSKICY